MSPYVLLTLITTLLAGLGLLAWGLRGRRINDHPVCRDCGFDLSAVLPAGITCPECGAGLKRPKAYRIGQRRRRPVALALGAVAVLVPLSAIGLVAFALITGADLDTYKPVGLLLWEGRHGATERSRAAAAELHARMVSGAIEPERAAPLIAAALDIQADPSRPWATEWGDIIERARLDGVLSEDDQYRFQNQAAVTEVKVRPRVRAGEPLPVVIVLKEGRIGSSSVLMSQVRLMEASIDDQSVQQGRTAVPAMLRLLGRTDVGTPQIGWFQMYGAKSPWRQQGALGLGQTLLDLPRGTAPGRHVARLRVAIETQPWSMNSTAVWTGLADPEEKPNVRILDLTAEFDLVDGDTTLVEVVEPTPELDEELRRILTPTTTYVWSADTGSVVAPQGSQQFSLANLSVPVAFQVVWRDGDREWPMGILTSGLSAELGVQGAYAAAGQIQQVSVNATLPGDFDARSVDVILRPDPDAAPRTVDLERIYGGPIVFEDVEVTWHEQTTTPRSRSGRGWLGRLLFGD